MGTRTPRRREPFRPTVNELLPQIVLVQIVSSPQPASVSRRCPPSVAIPETQFASVLSRFTLLGTFRVPRTALAIFLRPGIFLTVFDSHLVLFLIMAILHARARSSGQSSILRATNGKHGTMCVRGNFIRRRSFHPGRNPRQRTHSTNSKDDQIRAAAIGHRENLRSR